MDGVIGDSAFTNVDVVSCSWFIAVDHDAGGEPAGESGGGGGGDSDSLPLETSLISTAD